MNSLLTQEYLEKKNRWCFKGVNKLMEIKLLLLIGQEENFIIKEKLNKSKADSED